ncbi:DUF6318 family protein [Arthrobacter sp. 08Y14]|uniref:DUF6318 family protein n=1 Tax=Arthrobacter sp. 08Y14 TaxID=2058885 RepID=UPI0011B03218|nr:DUF6318 family protein [Arthrobacter sp. 08Y14]
MLMFRARSAVPVFVRLGAAAVAAVLVLGGCSGSGDREAGAAENGSSSASPNGSVSPSQTANPTATPTPTPMAAYKPATAEGPAENVPLPVMPELAKEKSKEGLEAFAEYWYAAGSYGLETGDATLLESISEPDCELCVNLYRMIKNGYENDDWVLGGKFNTLGVQTDYALTQKGMYQVLIQVEQDPLEYRGQGKVLYSVNAGINPPSIHMIEAAYVNDGWRTENAVLFQSGK